MNGEILPLVIRKSTFYTQAASVLLAYFLLLALGSLLRKDMIIPVTFYSGGLSIHFVGIILCLFVSNLFYFLISKRLSIPSKGQHPRDIDSP